MGIPAKSSAADRSRPTAWDGLVAALIAAGAVLLLCFLRPPSSNILTAVVLLENKSIAQYDLSRLEAPVSLLVEHCPYPLTIEAEPGRIRIAESACPGGDCVHTGWACAPGQQIICLPNRLVISLSGSDLPSIDAVTG